MRVSVVVATYQSARHLAEQLRSVLTQTHPVDEIIVTDDASTDGTGEIVTAALDGRVAYRFLSDGVRRGVVPNVERGLLATTGDVIFLSDHDDRWLPTKVSTALAYFAANPTGLLWFSEAVLIDDDGLALPGTLWERVAFGGQAQAALNNGPALPLLLKSSVVTGAAVALRRSLLGVALPFPGHGWHDAWLAQVAAALGEVHGEPTAQLAYRLHGRNVVGVRAGSLRTRWSARPRDFAAELAALEATLALRARLASTGGREPALTAVDRRADHLRRRLAVPEQRWRRLPIVVGELRRRGYDEFSEGPPAALYDVIRPRGPLASAPRETLAHRRG